ncbi:MAG TPA: extracellular solute-binding protein, partial [Longimicrobiales bacterium]|nr:extracellular solute-binding protein [Longimicrobiales bacterium]
MSAAMRPVARTLVALAALAAAAACAGDAGPPGELTLRVLTWAGDQEVTTEQRIADLYAGRHPGVRVVVESAPTRYQERLLTSIAAGSPPDVFLLDGPDIPTFLDRGLTLDLTPWVGRLGWDPERVFPEVMETFRRGGGVYALPKDFTPMVIYADRAVFRRFGVPLPDPEGGWTREAFLQTARSLTRDTTGDGRTDV